MAFVGGEGADARRHGEDQGDVEVEMRRRIAGGQVEDAVVETYWEMMYEGLTSP